MQLTLINPNLAYDPRFDSIHHWIDMMKYKATRIFGSFTALHKPTGRIFEYIDVLVKESEVSK